MSSHDLNHTLRHAHRVWLLARGKLIASGTRDSVLTAANLASAYHMSSGGWILKATRCSFPRRRNNLFCTAA